MNSTWPLAAIFIAMFMMFAVIGVAIQMNKDCGPVEALERATEQEQADEP